MRDMKTLWKVLLGLALVVPMGAYLAGTLATSSADEPAPRETIVIKPGTPTSPTSPTKSPTKSPSSDPSPSAPGVGAVDLDPDDVDSSGDDWGRDDDYLHDNSGPGSDDGAKQDDHSGRGGGDDND